MKAAIFREVGAPLSIEEISISKPTLIKLFKELAEKNILVKVQHKTDRFNESALENI